MIKSRPSGPNWLRLSERHRLIGTADLFDIFMKSSRIGNLQKKFAINSQTKIECGIRIIIIIIIYCRFIINWLFICIILLYYSHGVRKLLFFSIFCDISKFSFSTAVINYIIFA